MAIIKEQIKVQCNEFLQQVGETQVSGRTATIKVKGLRPGAGKVDISYGEGEPTAVNITVNDIPTPGDFTAAKNSVETGDVVKLTQAFDVAPSGHENVTFEYPAGVTEVPESKKLEGNAVTVEVNITTAGEHVIKSKYMEMETGKQLTITAADPSITRATASPESVDEEAETTITVNFNELA